MAAAPPETPSHIEDPLDEMTVGEADTYVEQFRRQLKMTREQVNSWLDRTYGIREL